MIYILLTQVKQNLGNIGDPSKKGGLGPFGDAFSALSSGSVVGLTVSKVFSNVLGVMTTAAGLWFIIQFVIGAYRWLTSEGDKGNVEAARNHLTHAVIGLTIVVITYILTGIIGSIVGLDILNPQNIIPILQP